MEYSAKVVEILTPQKYILNGLWFGAENPKRAIIFIHGLASNAFNNLGIIAPLADKNTIVITFSNRGHDKISRLKKQGKRRRKEYDSITAGEAHEVFTDCVDDIQGVVNLLRINGIKEIYLAGHSTGCQKSIYYLSKRGKQKLVKGVILLAPISDYAWAVTENKNGKIDKAVSYAKKLVNEGKPHELLPKEISEDLYDAQRFLSLYTPNSEEEIFSYAQSDKKPKTLRSIRTPVLAIFAEKDEYSDRSAKKLEKWFDKNIKTKHSLHIVNDAPHNFAKHETELLKTIRNWIND